MDDGAENVEFLDALVSCCGIKLMQCVPHDSAEGKTRLYEVLAFQKEYEVKGGENWSAVLCCLMKRLTFPNSSSSLCQASCRPEPTMQQHVVTVVVVAAAAEGNENIYDETERDDALEELD